MKIKTCEAALLAALMTGGSFAAEPGTTRSEGMDHSKPLNFKVYFIEKTATPPKIDGKIEDAAWQSAVLLDDFGFSSPVPPHAMRVPRTEMKALWDDHYLYLYLKCYEDSAKNEAVYRNSLAQIQKLVHHRDCIELLIDGKNDEWTQHTMWLSTSEQKCGEWVYDFGWGKLSDHNWDVAADWIEAGSEGRDAKGFYWIVETRVALADIEVQPKVGYIFGLEPARFMWNHQLFLADGKPLEQWSSPINVLGWGSQGTWHKRPERYGKCILVDRRPKDIVSGLRLAYPDLDRREVRIRGTDGYLKIEKGAISRETYLAKCRSLAAEAKAALAPLEPILAVTDKVVKAHVDVVRRFRDASLAKIVTNEMELAQLKVADVARLDKAESETAALKKEVDVRYYQSILAMMQRERKVRFPVQLDAGEKAPDLSKLSPNLPKPEDWKDPTLIAWGKPMASGKKKVLAFVNIRDTFAVQHLKNRIELEADVIAVRYRDSFTRGGKAPQLCADLEHALARGGYDGFLFLGVHADWIPDRARCRIVEEALEGKPIVTINCGGFGYEFKAAPGFALGAPAWFDKLSYANEQMRARTCIAARTGPGQYDLFETSAQLPPISRGWLGKGRVTHYETEGVENQVWVCRCSNISPGYTVSSSKVFQDEYCLAYAARVVAEGLGMRGPATILRVAVADAPVAGEPVKATIEVATPDDWTGLAKVCVRDSQGQVLETQFAKVGCGPNVVTLKPVEVGTHWVDATLMEPQRRKALDFAAARLEMTAGAAAATFAGVRSVKTCFEKDEEVQVIAGVRRCVPGLAVKAEIADVRGRVLDRGKFPVSGRNFALVRFSPMRLRLNTHAVRLELVDATGKVLDRSEQWIHRRVGDLEDFRVFDGGNSVGGKDLGERMKLFAWHGLDVMQEGNPTILQYGNDPAIRDRIPGMQNVWQGAMNCPRWKRWLRETYHRHATELKARNGRFISLGDDSGAPSTFVNGRPDWVARYFELLCPIVMGRFEKTREEAKADPKRHQQMHLGYTLKVWADEHGIDGFTGGYACDFYWGLQYRLERGSGLKKLLAAKWNEQEMEMFRRAFRECYDDIRVFNHANRVKAKDFDSIGPEILRAIDPDLRVEYAYFLRWLERRYDGDIAKLNAAWGSKEKDFWTIEETTIDELRRTGHPAATIDKLIFLEDSFLEDCRIIGETVHAVDPTIAVGYGASGLDNCVCDYFKYLDTAIPYGHSGCGGDFDVAVTRRHAFAGETIGWYGSSYGSDEEAVPEPIRVQQAWHTLLLGGNFSWMWTAQYGVDGARSVPLGGFGYSWRAQREMQRGAAALILRSQIERDGIAIFTSRACGHFAAVKTEPTTHPASRRAWASMLNELGLRYNFVSPDDIAAGALKKSVKLLVLPMCDFIDAATAAEITAFAKAGGKVVADFAPGGCAENGAKLSVGTLDGLVGKGLEIWNDKELSNFAAMGGKHNYFALRTKYEQRLAAAGVRPAIKVKDAKGLPVTGLSIVRYRRRDGWAFSLEKQRNPTEQYPMTVTVELPEDTVVYDVRANNGEKDWKSTSPVKPTPVTKGRSFKTTLNGSDIRLFSCQKQPIDGVELQFHGEPKRGGLLTLRAKVRGATAGSMRVLRVEFVPPAGFPWTEYAPIKRYVEDAPGGELTLVVPLAYNERGDLTVEVTDVASGATVRKPLRLTH